MTVLTCASGLRFPEYRRTVLLVCVNNGGIPAGRRKSFNAQELAHCDLNTSLFRIKCRT